MRAGMDGLIAVDSDVVIIVSDKSILWEPFATYARPLLPDRSDDVKSKRGGLAISGSVCASGSRL